MATIKSKNRRQLIPSVKQQSKERARRGERERCGHQHLFGLDVGEKRRSLIGCCPDAAAAEVIGRPRAPAYRSPRCWSSRTNVSKLLLLWWWRRWRVAAEDRRSDFCESLHHSEWGPVNTVFANKNCRFTRESSSYRYKETPQHTHTHTPSIRGLILRDVLVALWCVVDRKNLCCINEWKGLYKAEA